MKEEVRAILRQAVSAAVPETPGLGTRIASLFSEHTACGQTNPSPASTGKHPAGPVRRLLILDMDVVFELMRTRPDPRVIAWLDRQPPHLVWTTAITVFQIQFGIRLLPDGRRKDTPRQSFGLLIADQLERRVLSFDSVAVQPPCCFRPGTSKSAEAATCKMR